MKNMCGESNVVKRQIFVKIVAIKNVTDYNESSDSILREFSTTFYLYIYLLLELITIV